MPARKSHFKQWLWKQRNSTRLGFLLQMGKRVATSFFALVWFRLLVVAMGKDLYDLYLAFNKIFSLGGLGDLGMGGAISLRIGKYLGAGRTEESEQEITKFLSTARLLFLTLALVFAGGLVLAFPWLRQPLGLEPVPGSGPLNLVVIMGALLMAQVMFISYAGNLNYSCGNVTWPVVPSLIVLQFAIGFHWLLARHHAPLWVQYVPYVVCAYTDLLLLWFYTRLTHPKLAAIFPLRLDRKMVWSLLGSSFWVYLCVLGNNIYTNTDGLLIKAGAFRGVFANGALTDYTANYKFCELMVFVGITAGFVSLPKITQWLASADAGDQKRLRFELNRLNQFQTFLGFGAALSYLAFNSFAIKLWWHGASDPVAPATILLQTAFALNMAVTTGGDAPLQVALRTGNKGLRLIGLTVVLSGLLNLGLSVLAMKAGWLEGIALATVLAQSVLTFISSAFMCRQLQLPWFYWVSRACVMPLIGVALAGWFRKLWPMDSAIHVALLLGVYAILVLLAAWSLGITANFLKEEFKIVMKSLRK